jgi:hypothetical protein
MVIPAVRAAVLNHGTPVHFKNGISQAFEEKS